VTARIGGRRGPRNTGPLATRLQLARLELLDPTCGGLKGRESQCGIGRCSSRCCRRACTAHSSRSVSNRHGRSHRLAAARRTGVGQGPAGGAARCRADPTAARPVRIAVAAVAGVSSSASRALRLPACVIGCSLVFALIASPASVQAQDERTDQEVVAAFMAALNAGDADRVLGVFDLDTTVIADRRANRPSDITRWVRRQVIEQLRFVPTGPYQAAGHDRVIWTARLARNDWQLAGVEELEVTASALIRGAKIVRFSAQPHNNAAVARLDLSWQPDFLPECIATSTVPQISSSTWPLEPLQTLVLALAAATLGLGVRLLRGYGNVWGNETQTGGELITSLGRFTAARRTREASPLGEGPCPLPAGSPRGGR